MANTNPLTISSNPPTATIAGVSSANIKKLLLIGAVACAALSVAPSLRFARMLAARSIALLSNMVNLKDNFSESNWQGKFIYVAKVAFIALGLISIAIAMPLFMVISLAGDAGVQIAQIGKALFGEKPNRMKALIHFGLLAIDVFALAAILTGSWKLMIVSASFAISLMIGFAILAKVQGMNLEALCYLALTAFGISLAVTFQQRVTSLTPTKINQTYNPGTKELSKKIPRLLPVDQEPIREPVAT